MTLLVAVDQSAVSQRTLDAVRHTFPPADLKVIVLHVAEPNPDFVGWQAGPDVVRSQVADGFRQVRHAVEAMAAQLRDGGLDAVGLTVQGATVTTILAEAERHGADLIVVGSHGHTAAYELAIGSVTAGVIRKASVPVLVVPELR